ncbi:MAG: protein-disulfide reductase DsbD domain-containing protein, partial [Phycisphaerae bacterium]
MRTHVVVGAITLLAAAPAFAQFKLGEHKAERKARVTLESSVDAVVPGRPFDVALHFQLTPGWHIYWSKRGFSGWAPMVTWTLPEGFTAGELQFPVPKRHTYRGVITTNILEGEPVLLMRLTPPDTPTGSHVTVEAQVTYVVCNVGDMAECPEKSANLRLELPISTDDAARADNVHLFDQARRALPKVSSEYVTVTPSATATDLSPGETFDLLLSIDIAQGHRVQAHGPPTHTGVFLKEVPGVTFSEPVYPKPRIRKDRPSGKVSEYAGRVTVRIPAEINEDLPSGPIPVAGLVKYRPYTDKVSWLPPEAVMFSLELRGKGGPAVGATIRTQESGIGAAISSVEGDRLSGFLARFGVVGLLVGCFVYGLFLNTTPCVLPLLSIKVLGFVEQAHESRRRTVGLGLAFGVGVVLFFVVLGFLAAAGKNLLQYPAVVVGLGAVVMALALSMLGVYTLQAPATATKIEGSIQQEGLLSSFGKGALAPVLGFACTGPLLAGAFGWATQQPPHIAVLAFLFAGLGMASPYMLLGANPRWLSFVPKPGPWMVTFERIMGFLLLGMVVWLLHPLVKQMGAAGLEWTLVFLVVIGMA